MKRIFFAAVTIVTSVTGPVVADTPMTPEAQPAQRLPGESHGFEPTIASDRSGHVVVAAIFQRGPADNPRAVSRIACWRSADGGRTWSAPADAYSATADVGRQGDPFMVSDADGSFVLAFIARQSAKPRDPTQALVLRSGDAGATWREPVTLADKVDKTVIGVSPDNRSLAVAFTAFNRNSRLRIFRTAEPASQWQEVTGPKTANRDAEDLCYQPYGLALDNHGSLAVVSEVQGPGQLTVRQIVSTTRDNGTTWSELELSRNRRSNAAAEGLNSALASDNKEVAHLVTVQTNDSTLGQSGIYYRSSVNFKDWSESVRLSAADEMWAGYPAICAGGGLLHVSWMERRAGRWRVVYRGSEDGGKTWSAPVIISRTSEASELITDGAFEIPAGHYMGLATSGDGTVHAAWGVSGRKDPYGEIWYTAVVWANRRTK